MRELLVEDLEVPFDPDAGGFEGLHLTLEGAHSVHASYTTETRQGTRSSTL